MTIHSRRLALALLRTRTPPTMTSATVSSMNLPSEALRSILSFMSRKKLIHLSRVNRLFHHVIHSPPLTKKPLLKTYGVFIHCNCRSGEKWWTVWTIRGKIRDHFHASAGAAYIDPIISPRWVRFKYISIFLPQEHEHRRAWLELVDENSHCLGEARLLDVHYDRELEADLAELIDKIIQGAGVVETRLLRRN